MLKLWNPSNMNNSMVRSDRHLSTRDYLDRIMDHAFSDLFTDMGLHELNGIKNEDGSISYMVDVPGVKLDDIKIEVANSTVSIKAERKDKRGTYSLSKSFLISTNYDENSLDAQLENGVLTVSLSPKEIKDTKPKQIEIKAK